MVHPPRQSPRPARRGAVATPVGAAGILTTLGALSASCFALALTWRTTSRLRRPSGESADGRFGDLLGAGAAWLLLGCLTWLALLLTVAVADAVSAERFSLLRRVGCPPRLRRVLLSLMAAALVLDLPASATAAPSASWHEPLPGPTPRVTGVAAGDVAAGPVAPVRAPGRALGPVGAPEADTAADRADDRHRAKATVVVRRGESLWSIVADDLARGSVGASAPRPTATRIAGRVRALHAHNRDRIGTDPDLIVPGQRLRLPWHDAPPPGTAIPSNEPKESP